MLVVCCRILNASKGTTHTDDFREEKQTMATRKGNYKRKTDEERKAEVQALCEQLETALEGLRDTDTYKAYLRAMALFRQYSYKNTLLIVEQYPHATLVGSFGTWKKLGRHVRKGEKAIRILAPITFGGKQNDETVEQDNHEAGNIKQDAKRIVGYKTVCVFDIAQTEGEKLPDVINELTGDVEGFQRMFDAIVSASGVRVSRGPLPGTACGMCDTRLGVVSLRDDLSEAQSIKTLIHEVAHYRLHPPMIAESRAYREVQAESVAYVVAAHFGLDTSDYTLGYLDSWMENQSKDALKESLDIIARAAGALIDDIEAELNTAAEIAA